MQRWPRSLMVVYKPCNNYCSFKKYQSARTSALKTLLSETEGTPVALSKIIIGNTHSKPEVQRN